MSTPVQSPPPVAESAIGTEQAAASAAGASVAGATATGAALPRPGLARLASWEALLAILLLGLVGVGIATSPEVYLTPGNFTNMAAAMMEVSIMALAMALIIIVGEIDLSVESMMGLSSAALGFMFAEGVPLEIGIPIVLLLGAAGGLLNGLLVAYGGLPSLVVTLGTLALYRGLALALLGPRGVSGFPQPFTEFGFGTVPGTPMPWPLLVFAALAGVLAVVLHRTWLGRQIFAAGKNPSAALYSGVRVQRMKVLLFVLSGVVAALAGVILTARFASARADAGLGMTLTVVTIVLLGGVNIFGGRGTIAGVVLAAANLAVLGNVLRLALVSAELQRIAIGLLLITSVVIPTLSLRVSSAISRARRGRHPPPGSAGPGGSSSP
jgi:rhamnose transport system permease protein